MPSALTEMVYDEVSVVDRGANQESHVVLFKRDDIEKSKEFPASDFNDSAKGQKCSRWNCGKPATSSRNVGGRRLGACAEHQKEMTVSKTVKRRVKKSNPDSSEVHTDSMMNPKCGHRLGSDKCSACSVAKSALHKVQEAIAQQDPEALWDSILEFQEEIESVEKSWDNDDTHGSPVVLTDFMLAVPTLPINKANQKGALMPLDKDDLAPDVLDYVNGLEDEIATLTAAQPVEKSDDTEDIFKGLDPRVREVIEKAQKDATDTRAELAKRDDERISKEFIEKAATFKNLPINAADFGLVLKSIGTLDPTVLAEIERVLRAADAGEKTSEVFKQAGSDQSGTATPIEQVNAKAQELMKSDSTLTVEAARTQVYRSNPSLYDSTLGGGK